MTVMRPVYFSGQNLVVNGRTVLSGVSNEVTSSSVVSSGHVDGIFLGAELAAPSCCHVVSLGKLPSGAKFLALFRFKLWWMAQKMGKDGREIPHETQFLLLETMTGDDDRREEGKKVMYVVLLPLLDGQFRATLRGNQYDEVELCLESGDEGTRSATFEQALFIGEAGSDPFAAVHGAVSAVQSRLKSFRLRTEKKVPGFVDYFGWCTWDAFYEDVTQEGFEAGLRSLIDGSVPPRFAIIDDGWQCVAPDEPGEESGIQKSVLRLTDIKENSKFRSTDDPSAGMKPVVEKGKTEYGLKYVYVWHAITGYWGGVQIGDGGRMENYNPKLQFPVVSPELAENDPQLKTDTLVAQGIGLVNPTKVHKFYDDFHGYLARAGVDGVKVDVQCILETLGTGLGGRVELARRYHQALDASVQKNFPDNGCIACMCHHTDALYRSKQTAVVRASDDFYPRDPVSHRIHVASVAYNSLFLGVIMLPDWDMFHSLHPAAEYHASARAISGGPIYVSDAPGKHNFELLKKLVLPDGSILRALFPGRPTQDCLFSDPARDGVSLLKIWNMNKFTGVLGVYNCQGAAWDSTQKKNAFHHSTTEPLSGAARASDIHLIAEAATDQDWGGDCAVYSHRDGELILLPSHAALPISLQVLENEILTITPIKDLGLGIKFAPLGLVDMFNAGGAIEELTYHVHGGSGGGAKLDHDAIAMVCMEVRGCGRFGAFSSVEPRRCKLKSSSPLNFSYDPSSGFLLVQLESMPVEDGHKRVHKLVIEL